MKKKLLPLLGVSLLLASCATNDFTDEAQKQAAFEKYVCARDADSGINYGRQMGVAVMADTEATPDDKIIALELTLRTDDAYQTQLEMAEYGGETPISPRLDPDEDGDCHGWVWDKYIEEETAEEYDAFTYEMARESESLP
ncbi:MAG: hypothetical protein Q4F10_11765 [Corynebacterium glutamicum]|nr:hypothetical protein [Corynebacterium glutamicum]